MGGWVAEWMDGPADGLCVEVGAHAHGAVGRAGAQEERHCEGRAEPSRLEGRAAEEARLEPWVYTLCEGLHIRWATNKVQMNI